MDLQDYAKFVLALVLVLGLMGLLVWVLRQSGFGAAMSKGKRLSIAETLMLGPRHRLILLRRDDKEHLILLGPGTQSIVETGIARKDHSATFASMVEDGSRRT